MGEPQGGQADGGWRVRFERQLTRPVEEVWAVAGASTAAPGAPAPAGLGEGLVTAVREPAAGPAAYVESCGQDGRGRVRWELSQGTGHGARLVVTETGLPDPAMALKAWRDRIEALVRRLLA